MAVEIITGVYFEVGDSTFSARAELADMGSESSLRVCVEVGTDGVTFGTRSYLLTKTAPATYTALFTQLDDYTLYYYRAVAIDSEDTEYYGNTVTVRTYGIPVVETDAATAITATTATLNGELTDIRGYGNVQAYFDVYTIEFEVGVGNYYQFYEQTSGQSLTSAQTFSANLTGLTEDEGYVFFARANGAGSIGSGGEESFIATAGGGSVGDVTAYTASATALSDTEATLNGTLTDLNGEATLYLSFEYGLTTSYGTTTSPVTPLTTTGNITADITGLSENTTYHYRLKVTNGVDIWYFNDQTFTTILFSESLLSKTISGLDAGTTYHFRAVALLEGVVESEDQYWYGEDVTFTTLAAHTVETDPATAIDSESATLNGTLTSLGGYSFADCYFKLFYKVNGNYILIEESSRQTIPEEDSSGVAEDSSGAPDFDGTFFYDVENLLPNTTYYFRAYAEVEGAIVEGEEETFITEGGIVETEDITNIDNETATLNGVLWSLNGEVSLDVYFEYGINFEYSTTPETISDIDSAGTAFFANITSLDMNTEYAVKAVATDGTNFWYGEVLTFITAYDVIVKTLVPSEITNTSAILQGSIQLGIYQAVYWFEWGTTSSYGNTTSEIPIVSSLIVEWALSGLTEFAEYHYRIVVYDADEDIYYYGEDVQFYSAPQETTVASNATASWLFDLLAPDGVTEWGVHWSTKDVTFNEINYTAKIIPDSFNGVSEDWTIPTGLISAKDLVFAIDNSDFSLGTPYNPNTDSYLQDEIFLIRYVVNGEVVKSWKFKVMRLTFPYGKVMVYCQSLLQTILQGTWPKTKHPMEIWPSTDIPPTEDYCVPIIFGTAYIPVMSVNTGTERYYVLGKSGPTYSIEKVRSPHTRAVAEWEESSEYVFSQSTDSSIRLVQFEIADDGGGGYDPGVWKDGNTFLMPLCKYSRSDTINITNPADWIAYILKDMGCPASYLDTGAGSTFEAAKVIYTSRGITWNGGYWRKKSNEKILAELLILCDSFIYEGTKLELHTFSRANKAFLTKTIERTFNPTPNTNINLIDGISINWIAVDTPQDIYPGKVNVAVNPDNGTNVYYPSGSVIEYRFEASSVNAQRVGILYIQKNTVKNRATLITSILEELDVSDLKPGQVITLFSEKIFRMNMGVIITSMQINYNGTISLDVVELNYMNDWNDLDPSPISIITDNTSGNMD